MSKQFKIDGLFNNKGIDACVGPECANNDNIVGPTDGSADNAGTDADTDAVTAPEGASAATETDTAAGTQ